MVCDGSTLDRADLARRAWGLAQALRATGTARRDRVAVLLPKGVDVPVAFLGALASGGVLVPLDPGSPAPRLARILRDTGTTCLVTAPGRESAVRELLEAGAPLDRVVGLGDDADLPVRTIPRSSVEEAGSPPDVRVLDLDPCYVLHTSGSTGVPKLILHTHRSATSFVDWAVDEYGIGPEDRLTNASSHHTCFATFDYWAALRAGARTIVLTPTALKMTASLSALLERERATIWYSVPTALVQLSSRGALEDRDLSALRWVLFAGETFPAKHLRRLMEQLPDARFSHVYGSTETNVCTFSHLPRPLPAGDDLPPIGRPCSNAEARVVDDALRPVPDGDEGELWIRGATVMSGYWNDPERNAAILPRLPALGGLEETWYRTGDRVRVRPDGQLEFGGRADLQVKIRGHRVELGEVESALVALPGVEAAVALAMPAADGTRLLRAFVVPVASESSVGDRAFDPRPLRADLRGALPTWAVPEEIRIVEELPRTPTGKVDRSALRARLEDSEGETSPEQLDSPQPGGTT